MYHGAHWRCEPARAERINVEDPASTEDLVPQAVGQKLLITPILHAKRNAVSAHASARDVRCHSDIKDIRADAHRVPGARAGAKRPLSEPGRSRDAAQAEPRGAQT